jgi:hypothetical protein
VKKTFIFFLFIILSPLVAGLCGILLDELSYSIAPEFFKKFRFVQFGFKESAGRMEVAMIGWKNGWFIGILIGIPITIAGLIHKDPDKMIRYNLKAFLITIVITAVVSATGFLCGEYILTEEIIRWNLPEKLNDSSIFIALETMNNFSYMGGTTGMLLAILWQIKQKKKDEEVFSPSL